VAVKVEMETVRDVEVVGMVKEEMVGAVESAGAIGVTEEEAVEATD